jgi:hypothetical protein
LQALTRFVQACSARRTDLDNPANEVRLLVGEGLGKGISVTPRRFGLALVLLVLLVVAPYATGAASVVAATATITGSGTSYRLTVVNSGDRPILCFGLLLTGVQPTSATGPAGVLTRAAVFGDRGLVHMQGNAATPAIPVGATAVVDFRTNVPIPANAGGEIRYSDTCQPGSDVVGQASGPTPVPQAQPCACRTLTATLAGARKLRSKKTRKGIAVEFQLRWTMDCAGGTGRCNGRLSVAPVPSSRVLGAKSNFDEPGGRRSLTCTGGCRGRAGGSERLVVTSTHRAFGKGNVGRGDGRSVSIEVDRFCRRTRAPLTFDLVFERTGVIDTSLSDLNGNGIPDGKD